LSHFDAILKDDLKSWLKLREGDALTRSIPLICCAFDYGDISQIAVKY